MPDVITLPGFVGSAYQARAIAADCETLVNWGLETVQSATGKSPAVVWFKPRPGLQEKYTGLDGPRRAEFSQDGRVFGVYGSHLYEFFGVGYSDLGFVGVDDQPASISSNGHGGLQLLVISAGKGWIFSLSTNTLVPITSPGFPKHAVMGIYCASYFLVMEAGTSKVSISTQNNGLLWDGSNVIQTEFTSDNLAAIVELKGQVWLIGSQNTEVWQPTSALSIFEPVLGAVSNYGTPAPWSAVVAADALWMIGQSTLGNAIALRSQGLFINQEVSTYAISLKLARTQDLQECIGSVYQIDGHTRVRFTFPTTGPTLEYDVNEQQWNEDGVFNYGLNRFDASRWSGHAFGFGAHLVGDRELGTVYELSQEIATDNGVPIVRERTMPHINQQRQWLFWHQFLVDLQGGEGTLADPNPVVRLAWSDNQGRSFGPERSLQMGGVGQYDARPVTHQLGRSMDRAYRLRCSASVPPYLLNAYARVSQGLGLN